MFLRSFLAILKQSKKIFRKKRANCLIWVIVKIHLCQHFVGRGCIELPFSETPELQCGEDLSQWLDSGLDISDLKPEYYNSRFDLKLDWSADN